MLCKQGVCHDIVYIGSLHRKMLFFKLIFFLYLLISFEHKKSVPRGSWAGGGGLDPLDNSNFLNLNGKIIDVRTGTPSNLLRKIFQDLGMQATIYQSLEVVY